jgi:hypothetical protein
MGRIILTDGSVLMNTTFNDAQFVLDAKDKSIIFDSCRFNRCTFEPSTPPVLNCSFCIFEDCQGMDAWYKVILEVEL